MVCGACRKAIRSKGDPSKDSATIGCGKCAVKYHTACLSLAREELKQLRAPGNAFLCPACKANNRAPISDSTPIRGSSGVSAQADKLSGDATYEGDSVVRPSSPGHSNGVMAALTLELGQLREAFSNMKKEMVCFTSSLNSTTDDIFEFRQEIKDLQGQVKELHRYKAEADSLRVEVSDLRRELESHKQRLCLREVELSGIAEHKQENLQQIVSVLSVKLGVELDPRDVDNIQRVGKRGVGHESEEKPRPIVVSLTRRAPRDRLLKAARVRRGLSSDDLDIAGKPRRVFINERLTRANRVLFGKARSLGRELNYRFVWVTNGNIYMRRAESTSILHVTSEQCLDKLRAACQTDSPSRFRCDPSENQCV